MDASTASRYQHDPYQFAITPFHVIAECGAAEDARFTENTSRNRNTALCVLDLVLFVLYELPV